MSTLKDIAGQVGVSISAVSRALNNQPGLSSKLRSQIRQVAAELRYHPHAAARALRSKSTRAIGLMIPDILNPFFPALVKGVEAAARRSGHLMVLFHSEGRKRTEERLLRLLLEKRVDGLLIAPSGGPLRIVDDLLEEHYPIVVLDRRLPGSKAISVTADNFDGAKAATLHLLRQGRWPIFHVSGPLSASSAVHRLQGFKAALHEEGKPFSPDLVAPGDFTIESGSRAAEALLKKLSGSPGIFTANDLMALGVMYALRSKGIAVPDDVALVGFDDIPMGRISNPRLSTVAQPIYEMGRIGFRLLLDLIRGRRDQVSDVVLPPELIVRESSITSGQNDA